MCVYYFEDFIEVCRNGDTLIWSTVCESAFNDFGLWNEEEILSFICSNDGIHSKCFLNSRLWKGNPDQSNPVMIDAYKFSSLNKIGYIAFFYNPKTQKWVLKSFKRATEIDGTYSDEK